MIACYAPTEDAEKEIKDELYEQLKEEIRTQRWELHFKSILNKDASNNLADIPLSDKDLEINTYLPSLEEVRKAVSSMKSGKAPGDGCVSAHIVKTGEVILVRNLIEIFEGIREEE